MGFETFTPKILGMYYSDSGNVYNNSRTNLFVSNEMNGYVPILDLIEIKKNEDLRFVDGKNVENEIVTYNKLTNSRNLDQRTIKTRKIDVTPNDLYLGAVRLLLNFSDHYVTANLPGEFRKTYAPLESTKLENYKGKIFLIEIHTFNTPQFIRDVTGCTNYLETLLNKFKLTTSNNLQEIKMLLEYINSHWLSSNYFEVKETTSTIKIATMIEVDQIFLIKDLKKEVYITNKDVTLSLHTIIETSEHPDTMNVLINQRETQDYLKSNSFICYIVDNENLISDRYINIAGSVRKIQKIKNATMVNGLYIITTDENAKPHTEIICGLDKIDENQYVFRTVEEANTGADIKNKYKQELEKSRHDLELERISRSNESLELKTKHEREINDLKLKYQERTDALKKEMETFKALKDRESIESKTSYDDYKYRMDTRHLGTKTNYEERKFERDNTIETLKTVGAVVGLVAGGMVFYSKLMKS